MARTVTIDTNEWLYTDQNGEKSYVNNASTFVIQISSGTFTISTVTPLTLANGKKIRFDTLKTSWAADTDAAAKLDAGAIWIIEDNGYLAKWRVRTCTFDSVTTPTELTLVCEREDNPCVTFTLPAVTVGA